MQLGRELVACALRDGSLTPFLEAGISQDYLTNEHDPTRAMVFDTEDYSAWMTLTKHWQQHHKLPTMDMFQRSHPAEAYQLPASEYTAAKLVEEFQKARLRVLVELATSDLADRVVEKRFDAALELMERTAKLVRSTQRNNRVVVTWDAAEYDVEGRIDRKITPGIPLGVEGFDKQEGFNGFQRGWMACLLGRAKAGKTSFALLSALKAWNGDPDKSIEGKRVMFVSFEIAAGRTPDEPGVTDRLDSFGAGIDMLKYMQGDLSKGDQRELREFRADLALNDSRAFYVVQPNSRYTIDDLEADIERYTPDVVYVDGFYFMTDRITGKRGSDWEGHDNLAEELKALAMEQMITVVITHQVREKQLVGKKGKGIDDSAMMSGTGIIMAADMVLGIDVDEDEGHLRTLTCTRSRLKYLDPVYGTWDWTTCTFHEQAAPVVDKQQFAYGKDGNDDSPPFDPS